MCFITTVCHRKVRHLEVLVHWKDSRDNPYIFLLSSFKCTIAPVTCNAQITGGRSESETRFCRDEGSQNPATAYNRTQHLENSAQSRGRHLSDTTASTLTGIEMLRDVASFRTHPGTAASQLDNHEQRAIHGSERLFPKMIVNHPISDALPQETSNPPGPPRPAHRSAQPQPRTPRRRLTGLAHAHAHASLPPAPALYCRAAAPPPPPRAEATNGLPLPARLKRRSGGGRGEKGRKRIWVICTVISRGGGKEKLFHR